VLGATAEYFDSEDSFGAWMAERTEREENAFAVCSDLFGDWKSWAEKNGEYVGSQKRLTETLRQRGFKVVPDAGGRRGVHGILAQGDAAE
jgi:putative DNA primase/helicase